MGLLQRVNAARGVDRTTRPALTDEQRYSIDTWISGYLFPSQFSYNGSTYPLGGEQTLGGYRAAEIVQSLPGYMSALRGCPPAFASEMVRALVLSQARFTFRNPPWHSRSPRRTFGNSDLALLEHPWPNGTTGELLARMEWHAGLAGNAYVLRRPDRLRVLRPDWVAILYGSQLEPDNAGHALDGTLLGYLYWNGGPSNIHGHEPQLLRPEDVAHWSPLPDPETAGVGMSWITPAIRDLQGDRIAAEYKIRYFEQGAPQPLDAKVLTPTGWTTMGDVQVGHRIVGSDGKPHDVVAVYPQGERDIYRVHFSSGGSTECTEDHLWSVASIADRRMGLTRTLTLAQIMAGGVTYASGPAKWSVPLVAPVEFDDPGDLPLDPYLVGTLIGDGSYRTNGRGTGGVSLAAHRGDADEQQRILTPLLPAGVSMGRRDRGGDSTEFYFARTGGPRANALTSAVRALGMWDQLGHDKSVPGRYLRASVTQRVALLQGLIDTDGSVQRSQPNQVRFDSTSQRLAVQVAELAGSLGGVTSVRTSRVASENHRAQWRVTITRLPEWITPARLRRKAEMYRPTLRGGAWRYIQQVEYVGRKPAQCIGVDSDDHLYVTDDWILTHNTPNLVVKGLAATTKEKFDAMVDMMEERHAGAANAYRTLYLTAGADATVIGSNLAEVDFATVTAAGETRISVLSRVPPSLLGISEGLKGSSLNAGNFAASRRAFADTWVYPTLQDVAAALTPLVKVPTDAELWFDTADVPLLREDAKDAADIESTKAATIRTLVDGGFDPVSVVAAVQGQNMSLLQHSGLVSVQLLPPGSTPTPAPAPTAPPA